MADKHSKSLRKLQALIRNLPTDGEPKWWCFEEAPDYQKMKCLPVESGDKARLKEFNEQLAMRKKQGNHIALLKTILTFARYRTPPTPNSDDSSAHGISLSGLVNKPSTKQRFENWVSTLHKADGTRITTKYDTHFRNAIRQYGDLMGEDGRPAHIENMAGTSLREDDEDDYDPAPKRRNILYWDESIVPILDSTKVHRRDKALLVTTWDAGPRPMEMFPLTAEQLIDHGDHIIFEVEDSKTYDRTPSLIPSMPYLRKWLVQLDEMTRDVDVPISPLSLPPDQPIWTKQEEPEQMAKSTFRAIGRNIGNRLGYHRPTNLIQLRKSRASIVAAQGINEEDLRNRFGWKHGSTVPRRYIKRFSENSNQRIAEIDGSSVDIAEDYTDPSPLDCTNCERWSPQHRDACIWCEEEMTGEEETSHSRVDQHRDRLELYRNVRSTLNRHFGDLDVDAESIETAVELLETTEADPSLYNKMIGYVLMTEYDGLDIDDVLELINAENDDDLGSFFRGSGAT